MTRQATDSLAAVSSVRRARGRKDDKIVILFSFPALLLSSGPDRNLLLIYLPLHLVAVVVVAPNGCPIASVRKSTVLSLVPPSKSNPRTKTNHHRNFVLIVTDGFAGRVLLFKWTARKGLSNILIGETMTLTRRRGLGHSFIHFMSFFRFSSGAMQQQVYLYPFESLWIALTTDRPSFHEIDLYYLHSPSSGCLSVRVDCCAKSG